MNEWMRWASNRFSACRLWLPARSVHGPLDQPTQDAQLLLALAWLSRCIAHARQANVLWNTIIAQKTPLYPGCLASTIIALLPLLVAADLNVQSHSAVFDWHCLSGQICLNSSWLWWSAGANAVHDKGLLPACSWPSRSPSLVCALLHCSTWPTVGNIEGAGFDTTPPGLGRVSAAGLGLPCQLCGAW